LGCGELRGVYLIGGVAASVGSLMGMVGNLIHPATPLDDPQGVARTIAETDAWALIHLVIVFGIVLMLGGLVALYQSIRGGVAGALARFGLAAAVVGIAIGVVLVILDGVAAKQLADSMASRVLTIIGPTVITLWLLVIGVLLIRRARTI
jgi:hypothetical protein